MFYSHQLLSKKGPLGQVWIAATMHAKINRRRADQIDVSSVCMQILQPQVPLALRLSGILMGGVVFVFSKKVSFLLDDANDFLLKLKTALTVQGGDKTSLAQGKQHAKYDAVTIDYGYGGFEEIERLLLQPDTPDRPNNEVDANFFVIPRAEARTEVQRGKVTEDLHQAQHEDITLADAPFPGAEEQEQLDRDGDDVIPPPPDMQDDIFSDFDLPPSDNPSHPSPAPSAGLQTIHEELIAAPKPAAPQESEDTLNRQPQPSAEPESSTQVSTPEAVPRVRRRKTCQPVMDSVTTQVPAPEFNAWIQNDSDLIRERKRIKIHELGRAERLLSLPSTGQRDSALGEAVSLWPVELLTFWRNRIAEPLPAQIDKQTRGLKEDAREETAAKQGLSSEGHGHFSHHGDQVEAEIEQEVEQEVERMDHGSVERLRTTIRTPSTGGQDALDLTPQAGVLEAGEAARWQGRSTSKSGGLPLEHEQEQPGSQKSQRSRLSDALGELGEENGLPEVDGMPAFGAFGSGSKHSAGLRTTLTQLELMEETGPTQTAANPHGSINRTTANLLQYLRDHFDGLEKGQEQSFNELTEDLDKWHAARLFYQTCVLTSNRYLTVKQHEPYGDIMVGRGQYL